MIALRTTIAFFGVCCLLMSCTKGYAPEEHLSAQEQTDRMWSIIRYHARAPENVTFQERFYRGYDEYYQEQMALHRLDAYFIADDGTNYLLVSRRAPSLIDKRVATGIRMKLDEEGTLLEYEEVFRTWKMEEKDLVKKGIMLFDLMVKGKSLDAYLTKNSWPEEYIEFPDDRTYFDVEARAWKGKSEF